ncbi:MAG TPA: heavy-metal-associated domain-containing protein [Anaerolineae bacterium]|nr:heavy-metal-associated domain-containing protein [Anaerolineae bacterium]
MEKVVLQIPSMWADHHVLAVREALVEAPGVAEVVASSMYQDVVIRFDPAVTNPETLAQTLTLSGYHVGEELALPQHPSRIADAAAWFQLQDRITVTDRRDLEASGDHRKY